MNKIIINFCPTGMVPTKKLNPYVPVSPQEIIEQTHEAYELGITIAHLHARDEHQLPTHDKKVYQHIFEGVRKHCPDLVICASASGRNVSEFEKRSEVIELAPDMCSLTLSSLNFMNQASVNSPGMIMKLAEKMQVYGVHPELECFDLGMINYGKYLIRKNIIVGPFYWNLIFGNIAGMQATEAHLDAAINDISEGHFVSLGGLGESQLAVHTHAISFGYGVRVGLEDNLWMDRLRQHPATNNGLLRRIHELMKLNDKELFTSKDFGNLGFYNSSRP